MVRIQSGCSSEGKGKGLNLKNVKWIPVRIAHKSCTLKALSHTPKERKSTRDKCPSLTPDCVHDEMQYISSRVAAAINDIDTTRFIHDRVKKHLNNENSSMKKYIYFCQNKDYKGIDVKIIMSENDPVNLRLYEEFYIRKCKLTFNSREECCEFADLLLQYFILKTILLVLLEVLCLETVYH